MQISFLSKGFLNLCAYIHTHTRARARAHAYTYTYAHQCLETSKVTFFFAK